MSVSTMYEKSLKSFLKPIVHLLEDKSISEVMINGHDEVWVESKGKLYKTDAKFTPEGLEAAARNMAQYVGRIISDERPRLDARLPDGSRIHVVLPPIGRKGTTIAIRKFFPGKLTIAQLVDFGSLTKPMARFIDACVVSAQNLVVSGGTGSGKTTLLNVVSSLIPNEERILTIEDSAELQLVQDHLVPFESRPPDKFGKGAVTMTDLLASALRLRPDRIVIGEVRGAEAFDLVQSMNTGHSGSMCTVHANTPTDTLRRIESLCLMSAVDLPMVAVRAQIASAINLIVQCARFHDGSRRITHISEVLPLNEKGDYRTQDIFVYTITGKDKHGMFEGFHAPTGILPTFLEKCWAYGFEEMDESFFDPGCYGLERPSISAIKEVSTQWIKRYRPGNEAVQAVLHSPSKQEQLEAAFARTLQERDLEPAPVYCQSQPTSTDRSQQADQAETDSVAGHEKNAQDSFAGESGSPRQTNQAKPSGRRARVSASLLAKQLDRHRDAANRTRRDEKQVGYRPRPRRAADDAEDDINDE